MSFKPKTGCHVCERVKAGDKKLFDRINLSKAFVPGGEALTAIAKGISISYESVYNHTQKHQAPSKAKLAKQIKAKETKEALKEIQTAETNRQVSVFTNQSEMRRELLAKGKEALDSGDLKMTMNAIVTLLGQEQKAEEAAKDRGLEVMKMVNYFASGAGTASGQGSAQIYEEGQIING